MKYKNIILLSFIALLSACNSEQTSSTSVTNTGLWADIQVSETGIGAVTIEAELNVGGNNGTNIILSDGEYIEARGTGSSTVLAKTIPFLDVLYVGSMATTDTEAAYTVNLYRSDQPDVLGSTVSLPPAFNVYSPQERQVYAADSPIPVLWDPGFENDNIELRVRLTCVGMSGETLEVRRTLRPDDDGEYDLSISRYLTFGLEDANPNKLCLASLRVERKYFGELSDEFRGGGRILGIRSKLISKFYVQLTT